MSEAKQFRQGDILFVQVDRVPATSRKLEHTIIAEGESTGHFHKAATADATLYEDGNVRFLEALADTPITHEEHHTVILPKGSYRIIQQREYVPGPVPRTRRVAD